MTKTFTMRIDDELEKRISELIERRYVLLYGESHGKTRAGFAQKGENRSDMMRWLLALGIEKAHDDLDRRVGRKMRRAK